MLEQHLKVDKLVDKLIVVEHLNLLDLHLAVEHLMFVIGSPQLLINLCRYARRKWRGMSKRLQGFSLFVGNSTQWMRLAEYELLRAV